jgi:hypothetical protein
MSNSKDPDAPFIQLGKHGSFRGFSAARHNHRRAPSVTGEEVPVEHDTAASSLISSGGSPSSPTGAPPGSPEMLRTPSRDPNLEFQPNDMNELVFRPYDLSAVMVDPLPKPSRSSASNADQKSRLKHLKVLVKEFNLLIAECGDLGSGMRWSERCTMAQTMCNNIVSCLNEYAHLPSGSRSVEPGGGHRRRGSLDRMLGRGRKASRAKPPSKATPKDIETLLELNILGKVGLRYQRILRVVGAVVAFRDLSLDNVNIDRRLGLLEKIWRQSDVAQVKSVEIRIRIREDRVRVRVRERVRVRVRARV